MVRRCLMINSKCQNTMEVCEITQTNILKFNQDEAQLEDSLFHSFPQKVLVAQKM